MRTVAIQVYEDPGHPEGGHAIFMLEGLTEIPAARNFRLRSGDAADGDAGDRGAVEIAPLSARLTADGLELVASVEAARMSEVLPGTPVELELPDAGLRGEFVWPDIAPLKRPKRRSIVVHGLRPRSGDHAKHASGDRETKRINGDTGDTGDTIDPSAEIARASETKIARRDDVRGAAPPAPPANLSRAPAGAARKLGVFTSWPAFARRFAAAPAANVAAPATVAKGPPAISYPRGLPATSGVPASEEPARDRAAGEPAWPGGAVSVGGEPSFYVSARTNPLPRPAATNVSATQPAPHLFPMARVAGALLMAIGFVYVLSKDQRPPAQVATATLPSARVTPTEARSAPAAPAPSVFAVPALVERTVAIAAAPSLFDTLAAGNFSPRGTPAGGVGSARALELANAKLFATGADRDPDEGAYWLKRHIVASIGDERTLRALTQLGSLYAEPTGRAPDYARARNLWELAAAGGDPVAMCFLGLLAENGLGTGADRKTAFAWYQRSKQAGGCAAVDDLLARTRP